LVGGARAGRGGTGEPSWRAKWCTRKYAPSRPSSSAATANSIDCRRASAAVRTSEYGDGVQWPKERKPIFFTQSPLDSRAAPSDRFVVRSARLAEQSQSAS